MFLIFFVTEKSFHQEEEINERSREECRRRTWCLCLHLFAELTKQENKEEKLSSKLLWTSSNKLLAHTKQNCDATRRRIGECPGASWLAAMPFGSRSRWIPRGSYLRLKDGENFLHACQLLNSHKSLFDGDSEERCDYHFMNSPRNRDPVSRIDFRGRLNLENMKIFAPLICGRLLWFI